jgi:P4 family phage/plasmid primase-like protien
MHHPIDEKLCKIFTHMYGSSYKWDSSKLYHFNGIRWEECDNILTTFAFSNRIYDDFFIKYKYGDKSLLNLLTTAYDAIGNARTAKSCLELFKGVVLDVEFLNRADSIKGLIGFNNGVLDLTGISPVFRQGLPEDCITLNTRIDFSFIDEYDYIDGNIVLGPKNVSELSGPEKFIYEITDDDDFIPLLTILGNILMGGNTEQKTTFLTGKGSNGKSLLLSLLQYALGDYASQVSLTTYTHPSKNAAGPEQHLVDLKGRLLGFTCETSTDKFQSSIFKNMSAEDKIEARGVHSKKITRFMPLYKPIICTNELPEFTKFDDAVARRIRIIELLKQFISNPTEPHHRLIDENLSNKFNTPAFLNQFINLLMKHCKNTVVPSERMIQSVVSYVKNSNPIIGWIEENYELSDDPKANIPTDDLRKFYNMYAKALDFKRDAMSATTFGGNLSKLIKVDVYGKSRTKHAFGLKRIEKEEEEEEEEEGKKYKFIDDNDNCH